MPTKPATKKPVPVTNDDRVAINVALPKPLHRQLRIKAIENSQSLTEAIAAAVAQWVK